MKKLCSIKIVLANLSFLFLFHLNSNAQIGSIGEMQGWLNKNIVEIQVKDGNSGTGFICGKFNGGVYVLTARHVLGEYETLNNKYVNNLQITVYIPGKGGISNTSCYYFANSHQYYDVAVLKVFQSNISWEKNCIDPSANASDKVRFIYNESRKIVNHGDISSLNFYDQNLTKHFINSGSSVSNSASGSQIFTKDGIIGMLLETDKSEKDVLPIHSIRDIIKQDGYGDCFQLNNARKTRHKIKTGKKFLIEFDNVLGAFRGRSGYAAIYKGGKLWLSGKNTKGKYKNLPGACNLDKYEWVLWGGKYKFNEKGHVLTMQNKKVGVIKKL